MPYSDMLPNDLKETARKITDLLISSRRILVTAHVRPDGDAIGSVSGMAWSLMKAGKEVDIALVDGVPERFAFVTPPIEVANSAKIKSDHEVILVLDTGEKNRTGIEFEYDPQKTVLINIDHHPSNTLFGDINYLDGKAAAACEIVAALLNSADLPVDQDVALALMLGLITDSRFFQNEGLRHTTHEAAAFLLRTGVDTTRILNTLNSGKSEADLRVCGFGLSNFKLECNKRLGWLVIRQSDLKKLEANVGNVYASGIFNQMLAIKETLASVVIFEREDGMSACEFRSRSGIDVKEIAVKLGGGGHLAASGCSQTTAIDALAQEAVSLMRDQVNQFIGSPGHKE